LNDVLVLPKPTEDNTAAEDRRRIVVDRSSILRNIRELNTILRRDLAEPVRRSAEEMLAMERVRLTALGAKLNREAEKRDGVGNMLKHWRCAHARRIHRVRRFQ